MTLSLEVLHLHALALYFFLLKPYLKSTGSWKTISDGIRDLEDCLNNYCEYLNWKKADSSKYKSSLAQALDKNSSIRHLESCETLDKTYEYLNWDVRGASLGVPVVMK